MNNIDEMESVAWSKRNTSSGSGVIESPKKGGISVSSQQNDHSQQAGHGSLTDVTYSYAANPILWNPVNIIRRNRKLYHLAKGLRSIRRNGIKEMARIIAVRIRNHFSSLKTETAISKGERLVQENTDFPRLTKISIITPVCNTPALYLREMIESVISQSYGNWELCLTDVSGPKYENIRHICEGYAQKDPRIKYKKLGKGMDVSQSSNKAIEMSSGEYIALLDHDDVLHPSALYEAMRVICLEDADFIYTDEAVFSSTRSIILKHHKPDYAIDTLRSCNYIRHFTVFERQLVEKAGKFRSEFNGSYDYDLILRYTDIASNVCHIPKLLYFQRGHENSGKADISNKVRAASSAENAIQDHLKRHGISAKVENKFGLSGFYRVMYELTERPKVSIIIPNKDNISLLRKCLSSIMEKSTYDNYEIIIVENNSTKDATFAYYEELKPYPNISVAYWDGKGFNFSEICNFGAQYASGKQLIFLNNDVEIVTPNWIEEMLMYSQRSDVGMVGIKLYFLNGAIQHAGVILGLGGVAGHIYLGALYSDTGFMGRLQTVQNMSAVTAACMMIRRSVFEEVGLFAPEFCDAFNDVDLCLKIRNAGYLIVWTPYAEALHLESKSRGYYSTNGKKRKIAQETATFKKKWGKELAAGDPYYNCNFSLDRDDYSLK